MSRASRLCLSLLLVGAGAVPLAASPAGAAPAAVDDVRVEVLSGRADLVTGSEAYVRVVLPPGASADGLRVTEDGRDVTALFRGGTDALVTGLDVGANLVEAVLPDGRGARIPLTVSPIGGPVFSGPQIQPWSCSDGALDEQCNRPPTVEWLYMPTGGGGLQPYDPAAPPVDVATTTTDEGAEVPFVVRTETGVALRDEYRIAGLADPAQPLDPTVDQPGNNGKLVLTHGASCDTEYLMGEAPDVLLEDALSRGFAIASHALDNAGHNCNMITQAESLVVVKELVAERFGPLRYTIGTGCSGGSLVQQSVANAYPGVYQGILPQCSFTDAWSSSQQYIDFVALRAFLESPAGVATGITPAQYASVYGHPNPANAVTFTTAIPNSGEPTRDCPGVPAEQVYDETTNPTGVRCTLQDYMVNVFGETADGKARRPIGNTGIQYGLSGLQDGLLLPSQFVALNEGIGGFDQDLDRTDERTAADPVALERVYRSGAVNSGEHLDQVAIIDLGGPEPGAFHDVYRKYAMRDRLVRENGSSDNQVFWEGPVPLLGSTAFVDQGIVAMDAWLAEVEADTSARPLEEKVLAAKAAAGIAERCTDATGTDVPLATCDALVDPTIFSSPRIESLGGSDEVGFTDDTMECALQPLESADYGDGATFADTFSAAEQATLRTVFPTGVCDPSQPAPQRSSVVTWQTYADTVGGRPLGDAPVSTPFRAAAAAGPTVVSGPSSTGGARGGLAATGAAPLAVLALLAVGAGAALRRRAA